MGIFPNSGARDAKKDWKSMTEVHGLHTDSHWKAKEKRDRKAAKKARQRERNANKPVKKGFFF